MRPGRIPKDFMSTLHESLETSANFDIAFNLRPVSHGCVASARRLDVFSCADAVLVV